MNTYLVTYMLSDYGKYYLPLSTRLKKFPRWAKLFQRTWIIKSKLSANTIRNILSRQIEEEGHILVIQVTDADWAAFDLKDSVVEWMKKNV